MDRFEIEPTNYGRLIDFPTEEFKRIFPNSLPITVIEQTGNYHIPLENPMITPEILEILSDIVENEDYPYIGIPNAKRAFDYLGIDLPEYVYDPCYGVLRSKYPELDKILRRHAYNKISLMELEEPEY